MLHTRSQREAMPGHAPDPAALGDFLLEHLVEGIGFAMTARASIGDDRFLDITQDELEQDTLGTVRRVHDFLGLALDHATEAAVEHWASSNRRGARGAHRYLAEEYGLDTATIRRAFAGHMTRSGVPTGP